MIISCPLVPSFTSTSSLYLVTNATTQHSLMHFSIQKKKEWNITPLSLSLINRRSPQLPLSPCNSFSLHPRPILSLPPRNIEPLSPPSNRSLTLSQRNHRFFHHLTCFPRSSHKVQLPREIPILPYACLDFAHPKTPLTRSTSLNTPSCSSSGKIQPKVSKEFSHLLSRTFPQNTLDHLSFRASS